MTDDRISALERGQEEIFKALKEVNGSLHELMSFQRDIERHGLEIHSLQDRTREHDRVMSKIEFLDEKFDRLQWRADNIEKKSELEVEKNNKRFKVIENALPNLTLASNWVFKGVLSMIAIGSVLDPILRLIGK